MDEGNYNMGLHIASIFIILAASAAGVFMPVIASKVRVLRISDRVLTLGKQFGTGVILATAFIHTMPTAMANLSSPCLGPAFSENYTAFGGLFILISSLFLHWIEFVAVEHNESRVREAAAIQGIENPNLDLGGLGATGVAAAPCPGHSITIIDERSSVSSCDFDHPAQQDTTSTMEAVDSAVVKSRASSMTKNNSSVTHVSKCVSLPPSTDALSGGGGGDSDGGHEHDVGHAHHGHHHHHSWSKPESDAAATEHNPKSHHHHTQEVGHSHAHGLSLLDESQRRISTYILEAGIAAHSVIIGVSLGVSTGAEFTGLLVALVFHQFFEGFALGARIADLAFDTTYTHYVLALIFSLMTPVGVAIGIGISSSYNAASTTSLLVEGIFDSISTGILLYMGYVNLLAIEFNLNGELRKESKKVKSMCFIALWLGAAIMAVIGRFA
ncbi:high-affinity Zn(2+) transporter zrt1 [Dissophora globulifera]|nr:high-affinity Zn(2+) transporter zrt1 [Dissophora globulifera]